MIYFRENALYEEQNYQNAILKDSVAWCFNVCQTRDNSVIYSEKHLKRLFIMYSSLPCVLPFSEQEESLNIMSKLGRKLPGQSLEVIDWNMKNPSI